jgi:hypothetical protein
MSSHEGKKLLRELRAAFSSLPRSIPNDVSDYESLLSESITNTSGDVAKEFAHFDASLRNIFGDPETGLVFPERGQRITDLVEEFDVMIDSVVLGPESTRHLLDEIFQWGNDLVAAAEGLQHDEPRHPPLGSSMVLGKAPRTTQSLLPFGTPKSAQPSTKSIPKQTPMSKMRLGTLPFATISKEEAESQTAREFLAGRNDAKSVRQKESVVKQKKHAAKRAGAVRRQREFRERKRNVEIALGTRNSAGKKVTANVNNTVRVTQIK